MVTSFTLKRRGWDMIRWWRIPTGNSRLWHIVKELPTLSSHNHTWSSCHCACVLLHSNHLLPQFISGTIQIFQLINCYQILKWKEDGRTLSSSSSRSCFTSCLFVYNYHNGPGPNTKQIILKWKRMTKPANMNLENRHIKHQLKFQLLEKSPANRLGVSESIHGDVRAQPFFKPIDFNKLEKRQLIPPYKPKLVSF